MKVRFESLQWPAMCALLLVCATGCRQDMHNQPKMIPQRHTTFFADGRSARHQVPGTVSRTQQVEASYLTTGLIAGAEGNAMPFPVSLTVLARGQEQFNIYCSPCHSRVGNGKGAIVERGYYKAGNFQSTRLQQAPLGHFFSVITHGYGAMPNYSVEIKPEDRWAIAAYIRALQLSQNAASSDVPAGVRVNHMHDLLVRTSLPANFLNAWDDSADADMPVTPSATLPASTSAVPAAPAPGQPVSTTAAKPGAKDEALTASATPASAAPAQEKPAPPAAKGDVDHGKALYAANCQVCHQPTRAGVPPVFPSLLGIVEKDGEAKVRKVAKEGIADAKPPMPAHPDFTDTDLDDLIAFLKTK
jgi:mono/diheme cytochrome c family protein